MKRFEACFPSGWQAWEASETVTIKRLNQEVSINTKNHPTFGTFKTIINLDMIPAYTVQ